MQRSDALTATALDFLIVGAAKSGTTTLFELLRQHPELYMPAGKEDPFFSRDPEFDEGWESYARQSFSGAPASALWGTATPEYMAGTIYKHDLTQPIVESPERVLPERIYALFPEIRLIAILRDPVERCISHHRMFQRLGIEQRSIEEALGELLTDASLARARLDQAATDAYVVWGEYGRILDGYYEVFEADQIRVVFLDELASDPAGLIRSLYEHLGVDPGFTPAGLGRRYQPTIARAPYPRLDPYKVRLATTRIKPLQAAWRRLPPSRRERIDRSFAELAYRSRLWTRTQPLSAQAASSELRDALRAHYAPDAERLARLTGRCAPWGLPSADVTGPLSAAGYPRTPG